jgi:hypothetical protein
MSAALLLDVSSYYLGLVKASYRDPEHEFLNLPFGGLGGRRAASMMKFYKSQASGSGQAAMGQGMLWQAKRWMARALRGLCSGCPHSEANLARASALVEM